MDIKAAANLLRHSPLALNIYIWLTHRVSRLSDRTVISWNLLSAQFGVAYATNEQGRREFKRVFLQAMRDIIPVYADTEFGTSFSISGDGLVLNPRPMQDVQLKKSSYIDIPITPSSQLTVSTICQDGAVSKVAASLYELGILIASTSAEPAYVCVQENSNNFSETPLSPSHHHPFDFDCGDACFYVGRDAADLICAFLTDAGVNFSDYRDLVSSFEEADAITAKHAAVGEETN